MAFSDNHFNGINIPSVWRRDRMTKENETQTQDIESIERGVQHISMNTIETQTSDLIDSHKTRPLKTFNSPELANFVAKASEITIEEIKRIGENDVFERIERFQNDIKSKVALIQSFSSNKLNSISENSGLKYKVSSLCWNCNASVLAIGYKVSQHMDWCTHESYALLWSLFKTSQSEEPSAVLELDNCVSILISHPTQPSIYCSGALNGKISLWNTRNSENETLFASVMAHQSCVSGLHWTQPNRRSDFGQIISCGFDGKVFVWKIHEKSLQLEKAFVVLAQDMPRTLQIKGDKSEAEVGIVSMSFNCEDPNIFIIGCFGGAIFQCSLISKKPIISKSHSSITTKEKTIDYLSPVVMSYSGHRSHINVIQFCPLSRNIFFSCSSDSELRIYNILQTVPLIVVHTDVPILSGQWSPSLANIAAVGSDGKIYIYSINDTKVSNPSFSFSIGDNIFAKCLVYNRIEGNEQIAVIASNDCIQVWDLSLTTQKTNRKSIDDILRAITDDES